MTSAKEPYSLVASTDITEICHIGLILQISAKTVTEHIEHVKEKLNCYKQTSLVYILVKQGFDPDFFI